MDRRTFLGGTAAAAFAAAARPARAGEADEPDPDPWAVFDLTGREPDENGVVLPEGFRSRVVARAMQPVGDTTYRWPIFPDGGATFPVVGGYVYVCNSEVSNAAGGVGAIRFDDDGHIVDAYSVLQGTSRNCAGGATPWGTWLSCEEYDTVDDLGSGGAGQVWECHPDRPGQGTVRPAMGAFQHEAVAVDPDGQRLYLTEDQRDGKLYRFTPTSYPDLSAGLLEAAVVEGTSVRWIEVPDPSARSGPIRRQVSEATSFLGGEGIVAVPGAVFFTTKLDSKVWRHDIAAESVTVVYDPEQQPSPSLRGPDNITTTPAGDLLVAEDGGDMELVLVATDGRTLPMLRVDAEAESELAGPAFDPSGRRMYFSSQRGGPEGMGTTYEITGPFPAPAADSRGSDQPATTTSPETAPTDADTGDAPAAPPSGTAVGSTRPGGDDDVDVLVPVVGGGALLLGAAALWRLRTRNTTERDGS